jgi:hypothetical protein
MRKESRISSSSTTVGDSQSQGTSVEDAMDLDVVQATPNVGENAARVNERSQIVLDSQSCESGDSESEDGSRGSGDGDGGRSETRD